MADLLASQDRISEPWMNPHKPSTKSSSYFTISFYSLSLQLEIIYFVGTSFLTLHHIIYCISLFLYNIISYFHPKQSPSCSQVLRLFDFSKNFRFISDSNKNPSNIFLKSPKPPFIQLNVYMILQNST